MVGILCRTKIWLAIMAKTEITILNTQYTTMTKTITTLVVLALLGFAAWYFFFRETLQSGVVYQINENTPVQNLGYQTKL